MVGYFTAEEMREARAILLDNTLDDDAKLCKVFDIYKEDLRCNCSQLYYALLGWRDSHLKELKKKGVV